MSAPTVADGVLSDVEEHVRSVLDREVGGILVGGIDNGVAHVSAAIPALRAEGGSMNVTFTHDVWEDVLAIVDRDHHGDSIVGWYHSHPNFGVFLSDYDLFIHRNFFPDAAMVALVVDQLRGEAGWFAGTDEIRQVASYNIEPSTAAGGIAATESQASSNTGTRVLVALAGAVAAFALGWVIAPEDDRPPEPTTQTQDAATTAAVTDAESRAREAETRAEELSTRLDEALAAGEAEPAGEGRVRYTVARGDSLWLITERFYGDGGRWPEIAAANALLGETIEPGDSLMLPGLLNGDGPGTLSVEEEDG